ncbi:dynamin family protein [Antarctobacter heliothermus]|uniref:Dynamin family protein n=1 Tax=Antarctobacter heliothermus TaxID=74033 RepID=A0A239IIM2_9RHOB|nr:dynamin family protein [Antarctobacter heliothermus]SNS93252.1 Dynamin family protein [Antarctobacter heliothermus]
MTQEPPTVAKPRKPRVALMGEFSAGKSTLANLLLGQDSSPVQVTATQLPPVWYRQGAPEAQRITIDGASAPLPMDDWSQVQPDDTRMISVGLEADILHACDLIDMPGTADPNMAPDFWSRFLPEVDLAIWCTPANQAWRQSEAALWEQVPPLLWTKSLLLVTRIDQMQTERDRARVMARVRGEAGALFRDVLPISLTGALAGRDDQEVLAATGAAALVEFLCHALEGLDTPYPRNAASANSARPKSQPVPAAASAVRPGRVVPRRITRSKSRGHHEGSENRPA